MSQCSESNDNRQKRCWFYHEAMACTWGLYLPADDAKYAQHAANEAFAEINRLEALLSKFRPDSDVAQLSRLPRGESLKVSADTTECLRVALNVQQASGGAFDIAYAYEGAREPSAPLFEVHADHTVTMHGDQVPLDLGGVGKGYALDQVRLLLEDWDLADGLLHAGQSTVLACGEHSRPWRIPLRNPQDHEQVLGRIALERTALAGSGALLHGEHIRDPRSGGGAAPTRATWAVAPTAAVADALSTAFFLMGWEDIVRLCAAWSDVGGAWVDVCTGDGEFRQTGSFDANDAR
jgi:thiamine biosynthesis lipoprotein